MQENWDLFQLINAFETAGLTLCFGRLHGLDTSRFPWKFQHCEIVHQLGPFQKQLLQLFKQPSDNHDDHRVSFGNRASFLYETPYKKEFPGAEIEEYQRRIWSILLRV